MSRRPLPKRSNGSLHFPRISSWTCPIHHLIGNLTTFISCGCIPMLINFIAPVQLFEFVSGVCIQKSCPQNQGRKWNTDLKRSKKDEFISSCQGVFKAAICFRLSTRFFRNVAYVKPTFVHFAVQLVLFFAFVHFPFSVLPSYAISPTLRALSARRSQNASSSASS